jgi:hypothetical protein
LPPFSPQYPIINGSQITWFEIDTATSAANIATGLMATWFPNNQLAPMPDLAVSGDQYGVCGEYGASVCAPSFAVLRAGDYVYIQVRNVWLVVGCVSFWFIRKSVESKLQPTTTWAMQRFCDGHVSD